MPFDGREGQFGDVAKLIDARSRIADPRYWVKGTAKEGMRYCVIGALSDVCGSRSIHLPNEAERRLTRILAAELPWQRRIPGRAGFRLARWSLIAFNDRPRTPHSDVLGLFDRAIERLTASAGVTVEP